MHLSEISIQSGCIQQGLEVGYGRAVGVDSFMRFQDVTYGKDVQAVGVATYGDDVTWKYSALQGTYHKR